ncbi:hypothetical protein C0995_014311 [Termitomyces sp. Mi166|nr:hypothetical protein C0995_014311 [Termitomyces sp. Mi166\
MDCLELNIHQRILSDLASSPGGTEDDILHAQTLIAAKVHTRAGDAQEEDFEDETEEKLADSRVFMSTSRVHCNIAFGELIINFPESHIKDSINILMPVLVDILNDVPFIDFDKCLSWQDWSLPDQLVYSTVSALLRLSSSHPQYTEKAASAICFFLSQAVEQIKTSDSLSILTQLIPAVHGLYRAISSTSFAWTIDQWGQIAARTNELCSSIIVDRLNHLLAEIIQKEGIDGDSLRFVQTFVSRYVTQETQWTVLAQALVPPQSAASAATTEAAAANRAWLSLMRTAPMPREISDKNIVNILESTVLYAMQCFTDLLVQIDEMETEPSIDTYAWETMSESLKLASVCSVALQELDGKLFSRLQLLLSEESPISDNLVQEAALKATTVLVQSFPEIASIMATHLRRFVTSPLPVFEFAFVSESRAPPPLVAAAKCLAHCIRVCLAIEPSNLSHCFEQLAPGDDLIMSNMYSLLNYIAAASKDTAVDSHLSNNSIYDSEDYVANQLVETGLRGLSEDEKRLVSISTISVVTRLALEFNTEEVTRLTISMLLQRLRHAEPTVEAAIAYNLVDLALSAPGSAFADIIRVFSLINRSANPNDPRFSNNMVLAAQTRLAQELYKRPELYDIYLVELLTLFADKGVAIQNLKITNHEVKTDNMIDQLASLLLPIDALLAHDDFNPQIGASTGVVSLFRNMWFLCVLFQFTNDKDKADNAMNWLKPALSHIAIKTPSMVLEEPHDSVASDVEYNSVIRQEYAHTIIAKHRTSLTKHISLRASDVRNLSSGQIIFILALHDIESMRSAAGLPSSLVAYFTNDSINKHAGLSACMESVAEKVIRDCINELNAQASQQMLPVHLSAELQNLLVYTTHRIENAREIASKYLNRLITSFPSLMCDPPFVFAILEVLTLLRQSCENEFLDEYNPVYEFHSERAGITLQMTDDYQRRNDILGQLYRNANTWFELAMARAPIELQSTLQKYLAVTQSSSGDHSSELGASVAEHFGKAIGPVERQLTPDKLDKLPPHSAPSTEIQDLKRKMSRTSEDVLNKSSSLTVQDLKRLLFRCAAALLSLEQCDHDLLHHLVALPFEVSTPPAITAGIQVWTWVISNKPNIEVALMAEVLSAWSDNIKHEKGMFSSSINYQDPFYEPISYSPTDKEIIDRGSANARRMLTPHVLVLQMLFSRLQAARYRRPGMMFLIQHLVLRSARAYRLMRYESLSYVMTLGSLDSSTHALAREERFSLLLFGFETLKSSHLDPYSESLLRESLYSVAFAWFSVRPQWSYGANRAQVDADVKVLAEFLSCLQTDSVRETSEISSLSPAQKPSRDSYYANRLRSINHPLRLLTENEMMRLSVWNNPTNDPKRGNDHIGTIGAAMLDTTWHTVLRTVWDIAPAIAVYLIERFKNSSVVRNEVTKMVRANPLEVLDVPEALSLFIGDKHLLLWYPVPPVIAIGFFEPRYNNEPLILQYAHRVLEQHPVDLTFFFVPQVVQALRYDKLGYVAQFIFETTKISQLFCHQIIWNMKANCYKDDVAGIEDPMKPTLDFITERVVESLSGSAREFYNLEFNFFDEVTSISGKLKPFIKRTKPEKKAKIDEEMAKIDVNVGVYLPSNPDGRVVDIDKKSGRPLQSHAKAPFMATFKVQKERIVVNTDPDLILDGDGATTETKVEYDVWQQAIFKVGDDCRQDVLALQIIAMFKNIFTSVGLTLYLFPYRVTATGPGCGVIDVVPNATSRDEMGRAKVNDLLDFFVAKYGGEDTVAFQKARLNFIQSMAAYSVACYILQIKDRHNGNIMIDSEGHIGVKFEPNSFKLNHEMVVLMGGRYSQGYQLFQNLTVKAFLAIRPHAEQLISTVQLMLDTGLPSFKGEPTIKRLRDRFALGLNERQAAEFMMGIIKNAHENIRSTAYDEFQRLQNGIPYK